MSTQWKCFKDMQKSEKQCEGTEKSSVLVLLVFFLMLSLERIRPQFLRRNHSSLFCASSRHIRSSAWQSPIFLSCCAEKHSPSHYILGSIPRLAHRCPLFQIFFLFVTPHHRQLWNGLEGGINLTITSASEHILPLICKCTWNISLQELLQLHFEYFSA